MDKARDIKRPKFRKRNDLTNEQLIDPDFRIKQLEKMNKGNVPISCSKCHHCR